MLRDILSSRHRKLWIGRSDNALILSRSSLSLGSLHTGNDLDKGLLHESLWLHVLARVLPRALPPDGIARMKRSPIPANRLKNWGE